MKTEQTCSVLDNLNTAAGYKWTSKADDNVQCVNGDSTKTSKEVCFSYDTHYSFFRKHLEQQNATTNSLQLA